MHLERTLAASLLFLANAAVAEPALAPIEPQMVTIKAGDFLMGSVRSANTQPVRSVALKSFRIGKYEVTAAEFQRFAEATRYKAPRMCLQMASKRWFTSVPNEFVDGATLQSLSKFEPATCIGWNGAQAYVAWLAKETGKKYRLPSEAEWEYASRAGSSARYFFGNEETQACRYANLADRSAEAAIRRDFDGLESREHVGVMPCDDKAGYASIVGMYEPNAFGLHDTLGNIAEFVQDCEHDTYAGAPADGSAWVEAACKTRVVRGGAWHWRGYHASHRGAVPADFIGAMEGFRVAEDIGSPASAAAAASAPGPFGLELAEAQKQERARRAAIADIPRPKI
ncbi:MAG TPA: SUMF1/EgtB/PvdO family nonheme iron enzyme [Telluria sp.]|jgi:formylglycine-generating enzyme required for sulfatase activity